MGVHLFDLMEGRPEAGSIALLHAGEFEKKHVDSPMGPLCQGVLGRTATGVECPWPTPRFHSGLERVEDLLTDLLANFVLT